MVGEEGRVVDFDHARRDDVSRRTSETLAVERAPGESRCVPSRRSRRQATRTVSKRSSTHLTEAELEDEMRDMADLGLREEAAETVDEEQVRLSDGGSPVVLQEIRSEDPADEVRTVPKRNPEGKPSPRTPDFFIIGG
jgi:hypothetical protein